MSTVLYVQASPRGERSHSTAVAEAFLDAYRQAHPEDETDTLNVFAEELPALDGLAVQAKYTILHGQEHTAAERDAWRAVEDVIRRFTAADKYVLSVPMWNFGVPYRLKQYLDLLVQPGYTFRFAPDTGYTGLVTGRPAFVAYARGGEYPEPEGAAYDHQKSYVELVLGFLGFTDVRSVVVEPTLMGGPDVAAERRAAAIAQAQAMAKDF